MEGGSGRDQKKIGGGGGWGVGGDDYSYFGVQTFLLQKCVELNTVSLPQFRASTYTYKWFLFYNNM